MNGYERISAALKGEQTDKVPVMLHNFMMASKEAGQSMEDYRNDPDKIAEAFILSVEKYEYDGILVDLDTVTLAGAASVPVSLPRNEPGRLAGSAINSLKEISALKPVRTEQYKYVFIWLEAVRKLKEHFGDTVFIRGNCDQAPFSLASMIRGINEFMTDLFMSEEKLIFELLDYAAEISIQFIKLMAQTGADMVSNGDSTSGPELISPEMYEKYALPYEKKMVETAHKNGLPYCLHICGNTDLILESMLKTGADAFELDYKTDINLAFETFSGRSTFIGNIDPSGVLALGSPEYVRKKTLQLLEVYGRENRFILNAGCAIPAETPAENLSAMLKAAKDFS